MPNGFAMDRKGSKSKIALYLICLLGIFGSLLAQSGVPPKIPQFEVVSIKPDPANPYEGGVQALPGGRLIASKMTVRALIQNAWGLKPFQLLGGPGWIDSAGYDIEAKAEGNPDRQEMTLMMRALLEDRFKLKVHHDTRQLAVYNLVPAANGIRLRPAENGCVAALPSASVPCGRAVAQMGETTARLHGKGISMAELIRILTSILGRKVIDKSGFTSSFDLKMEFAIDDVLTGFPVPTAGTASSAPTILTAVQEQAGLKLAPAKGPVAVLIIDSVEKPTAN
jgi:uncharacterized protein (TIGR03435 family)